MQIWLAGLKRINDFPAVGMAVKCLRDCTVLSAVGIVRDKMDTFIPYFLELLLPFNSICPLVMFPLHMRRCNSLAEVII